MNKILSALNYVDDELIYCALESINTIGRKPVLKARRVKQPKIKSPTQGNVKVKAVAFGVMGVALCAVIAICSVLFWNGNHAVDQRAHGEQKILGGISEISVYYPDEQMSERLTDLNCINYDAEGVQLYYDKNTDWRNYENWNSLLLFGEIYNSDSYAILYCLFENSLDYWRQARPVYGQNSQIITVGETQVLVAAQTVQAGKPYFESYAVFEFNNIVYELCLRNDTSNEIQTAILQTLLNV